MKYPWIEEGLEKPGKSRVGLARALGRQPSMVTELLSGKRKLQAAEIPIIAEYLDVMPPALSGAVRITGRAGAFAEDAVAYAPDNQDYGEAPMPPGGAKDTVAIEVVGGQLRGVAPDGSLLYHDAPQQPPKADMMGELCVVGLPDDRVLVKYLHRGRGPGLYDLESASAPTLRDVPVLWAALVTAIIPRPQARKIVRRPSVAERPAKRVRKKR